MIKRHEVTIDITDVRGELAYRALCRCGWSRATGSLSTTGALAGCHLATGVVGIHEAVSDA